MTGKQVATKDDVQVIASVKTTATEAPNATGSWQAGEPTFSEYEKLKLNKKRSYMK